ncbi:hypothetical protein N7463_005477 [Penicillium fimorum]|uniref:Uncharacterized protein n=1 Tax=Penicillium fimorum TaxID=1882269 RepID=A0A9W9XSM4_9EURO|nr:hypothetical protein N7463_005477 [Penicillium fimorum]
MASKESKRHKNSTIHVASSTGHIIGLTDEGNVDMTQITPEYSTDAPASKAGRKDDESSTNTPSLTGPQYDQVWYSSPLDDPSVGSRNNYHEKRAALRSLKSAKDRIDHDIAKVSGFLTETGHINSSSDDGEDSGSENVFAGFKLMKVGTEAEQEGGSEEEEDEGDDDMTGEEQDKEEHIESEEEEEEEEEDERDE